MQILNPNSHSTKSGAAANALRITAVGAALLAAPAIVHTVIPTSLAILQIVLEVCQFCVSVLRICGI